MLGLFNLLRLRRAPLAFYAEQHRQHGDHSLVRLGPYRLWLLFHPREIEAVLTECTADSCDLSARCAYSPNGTAQAC